MAVELAKVGREGNPADSHTTAMPRCGACGSSDVRLSMKYTALDSALSAFRIAAFRCRSCRHRFYRFRRRSMAV
jgi:hypothetical protein